MAASTTSSDDEEDVKGIIEIAKDKALHPLYLALSKPARRAYIQTALLLIGTCILFALAITSYSVFYYAYIPYRGFSVPVHLQFHASNPATDCPTPQQQPPNAPPFADALLSSNPPPRPQPHHPHGTATGLAQWLVTDQAYDVTVELTLPRSRANRDAGNFMVELALLGPETAKAGTSVGSGIVGTSSTTGGGPEEVEEEEVLAVARRPAILTWYSEAVENVNKAVVLPWYVLGWRREAERLEVPMMERVRFERGAAGRRKSGVVPERLRVEVAAVERMQVYGCRVVFEAKLQGLRYIMYNWRFTSAFIFTATFWAVEMTFMILAWLVLSNIFAAPSTAAAPKREKEEDETVKTEAEDETDLPDLSDTPRTFPTYAGQPSLRYESPQVKSEEEETAGGVPQDVPPTAAAGQDADDEDEDADFVLDASGRHMDRDSGLGTSMESGQERRDTVRKRRSGLFGSGSRK